MKSKGFKQHFYWRVSNIRIYRKK